MNRFFIALQFLTVFRVRKNLSFDESEFGRSMYLFPVIGALQGLILLFSWFLLSTLLPETVATAILILILVLTNGGLHLDGFADTVDGLAGGKTPEERLRIMKDSSTGAIGVVFVVLILLIKYLALLEMPYEAKARAIVAFPIIGRWAMVPLAAWLPYARPEGGLGAAFAGCGRGVLLKATAVTAVIAALLFGLFSLALIGAIGVMVYLSSRFFRRKVGGVTGDVFGFHSEAAEVTFLVLVLALMNMLTLEEY
jgi:adenosylcobinamide-GDP ribazoletransferase